MPRAGKIYLIGGEALLVTAVRRTFDAWTWDFSPMRDATPYELINEVWGGNERCLTRRYRIHRIEGLMGGKVTVGFTFREEGRERWLGQPQWRLIGGKLVMPHSGLMVGCVGVRLAWLCDVVEL